MSIAPKRRAALLVSLLMLLGLAPGSAAAASGEGTPLTPELATLAEPAVAAAPEALQAEAMGLPTEGPGSLVREGGDVVVEAHFDQGALSRTAALEASGATILDASGDYQTVALSVAPEDLGTLAEVPGLEAVEPSLAPVFYGAEEGAGATTSATSNGLCEGGSVISQAMTQLRVDAARGAFGARGAGQTIGVISDSFNRATEAAVGRAIATHASEDEVTNDLPGPASTCSGQQVPVRVLAEGPAGTHDEGRAMLQVIHDLAPHAELAFATAYATEIQFAHNIELLAKPVAAGGGGADVIVDDVSYYSEPFFQDGPVAVAIDKVTEEGVTYLTAAGNDNLFQGSNEIASWERTEFHDAPCPPTVAAIVKEFLQQCMNFAPSGTDTTFGITVKANAELSIDLQWGEPWYGVQSDLDAYLLNAAGNEVLAEPRFKNVGKGPGVVAVPLELVSWKNPEPIPIEVQLVIDRCFWNCNSEASFFAAPRLKFILTENGDGVSKTQYPKSEPSAGITVGPTIYGHAGSKAAITLAAADYHQSATKPEEPEPYSSRGPVLHLFGPVVGTTPAAPIGEEEIEKPNVTATDCASTTFFATPAAGAWYFCGTSEAAPHAAAIVALMRQTQPSATPGTIVKKLESSATSFPFTPKRHNAVGAGLVNAKIAIAAIGGAAVNDPASTVVPPLGGPTPPTQVPTTPAPSGTGARKKSKPKAKIVAHPKAVERTHRSSIVGRFRFTANEKAVTFSCQVDKAARRPCGAHFKRRFGIGRHMVKVFAINSSEHTSSAPVAFRFRVKRLGR
ncbi:MAG TPA: S8 family serine peptidase [Solirubrobacterales bacterium]|nr:S8 family serine peptidase [Solirubrobacterales bacterium]